MGAGSTGCAAGAALAFAALFPDELGFIISDGAIAIIGIAAIEPLIWNIVFAGLRLAINRIKCDIKRYQ